MRALWYWSPQIVLCAAIAATHSRSFQQSSSTKRTVRSHQVLMKLQFFLTIFSIKLLLSFLRPICGFCSIVSHDVMGIRHFCILFNQSTFPPQAFCCLFLFQDPLCCFVSQELGEGLSGVLHANYQVSLCLLPILPHFIPDNIPHLLSQSSFGAFLQQCLLYHQLLICDFLILLPPTIPLLARRSAPLCQTSSHLSTYLRYTSTTTNHNLQLLIFIQQSTSYLFNNTLATLQIYNQVGPTQQWNFLGYLLDGSIWVLQMKLFALSYVLKISAHLGIK